MKDLPQRVFMNDLLASTGEIWKATPDRIALKEGEIGLTYAQLEGRANHLARKLVEDGAEIGDFVAYLGPTGIPFVVTFWACLKAGTTFLPISAKFPPSSVAMIISTAKARFFMSDMALPDDAQEVRRLAFPGEEEAAHFAVPDVPETTLCMANSTSGSTGTPKVVGHSREVLSYLATVEATMSDVGPGTITAHCGTMWVVSILSALSHGSCITCLDVLSVTPQILRDWLAKERVNYWFVYPALFRTLEETHGDLPDLNMLVLCGESIFRKDFELFERLTVPGAILYNTYGQQEFLWATWYKLQNGEQITHDKLPVGRVEGQHNLLILDEDGQPVGPGEVGEITHRSFLVPDGYIGNPERTARAYSKGLDGIHTFSTGDLGYLDGEGNLHFVGRRDDQIKIRGFNVVPTDIEQEIKPHPEIEEVAVTVNRCARGLPRLACFYKGDVTPAALKAWLTSRIPSFMMPQFFVPLEVLPRTATGKLQRNRLVLPETLSDVDRAVPETDAERDLSDIWQEVLGHADFGVTDNFFDVGGDSLRAMELVLHVENRFERLITLDQLVLSGSTIRDLASMLSAPATPSELRVLKPGDGGQHLVLAHVYSGGLGDYLEFSRVMGEGIRVSGVCADYSRRSRAYPMRRKAREAFDVIPKDKPPVLMGFSFGAMMAFEIAHCFEDAQRLVLVDPVGPFNESIKRKLIGQTKSLVMRSPGLGKERTYWGDFWYRPKRLKTSSALLITCDTSYPKDVAGWLAALDGPVEQFKVSGTHWDIFKSSNAREIAVKVQDWMARTAP